jgi:hypothetical protein
MAGSGAEAMSRAVLRAHLVRACPEQMRETNRVITEATVHRLRLPIIALERARKDGRHMARYVEFPSGMWWLELPGQCLEDRR